MLYIGAIGAIILLSLTEDLDRRYLCTYPDIFGVDLKCTHGLAESAFVVLASLPVTSEDRGVAGQTR